MPRVSGQRLTEAQRERIRALAELGRGLSVIARDVGRTESTVQWFMYCDGLRAPKPLETPKSYWRGNLQVHRFTADEDAFIEALRVQGICPKKIAHLSAQRFGTARKEHSIRCRLIMLAARESA